VWGPRSGVTPHGVGEGPRLAALVAAFLVAFLAVFLAAGLPVLRVALRAVFLVDRAADFLVDLTADFLTLFFATDLSFAKGKCTPAVQPARHPEPTSSCQNLPPEQEAHR
jgi:hypothetical protein